MAMRTLAALMLIGWLPGLSAQTMEHVAISQVVVDPDKLTAYLDVRGADDKPVSALTPSSIQATIDGTPLPINALTPFTSTHGGIAYVFLVDVSKSESSGEFAKVKKALEAFVEHLSANDRAAIVTFGERTEIVAQYTGNKATLQGVITKLSNNAPMTHLNEGLLEAMRLARRMDASLPVRRGIVILSDGKDEGSGLTTDDVLREFQENRIPIYAVGASDLPKSERAQYLEVLHRYAVLSGGAYYEATADSVDLAYRQIHDRIAGVWVAELGCASCPADGRSYPLLLRVTVQGQTLADKSNVTPVVAKRIPLKPWWRRLSWSVYAAAGAALLLIVAGLIILASRRKVLPPAGPESVFEQSETKPTPSQPWSTFAADQSDTSSATGS